MNRTRHFDVVILGAGIAGLSAADALIQKGVSVAVADRHGPGSGASGAPAMLINPATGRRAKKAWRAEQCMEAITDLLERVQDFSGEAPFFEKGGIIRPAPTPDIAKDFRRSPQKYNWPEGWIEWLEKDDFSGRFPLFSNHFGGLIVRCGMTMEGPAFINALSSFLKHQGMVSFFGQSTRIEKADRLWNVTLDDETEITAGQAVFAAGGEITEFPLWNFLPLHRVKGQTATFHFRDPLPVNRSISSLGYFACLSKYPNRITVGSTYEHNFSHTNPDEQGLSRLKKKLETTLPETVDQAVSVEQWSGVRVSVMDKKPVIGPHPAEKNAYLFTALGSKGLLMGRYLGEQLSEIILTNKPPDREISVERLI